MANPIGWVEIPVLDMARAIEFYNKVFGWKLASQPVGDVQMAFLPSEPDGTGATGALVYAPKFYQPSASAGVLIYFTCADCTEMDEKTERAGGRCIVPKREIAPGSGYGYMSVCLDVEGNRIAFHSRR